MLKKTSQSFYSETWDRVFNGARSIHSLDDRLRMLDKQERFVQTLTLTALANEKVAARETAIYLFIDY